VQSDDGADDGETLTVEDEGAGTSEDVTLDASASNGVQTTATFADIDALWASAHLEGEVRVYEDDGSGTSPGDQLATLRGAAAYPHDLGDRGVPALGSGSHAGSLGSAYEVAYDGDTLQLGGEDIADNFGTHEVSVANNVDSNAKGDSPVPSLNAAKRECEVASTVWGEVERYEHILDLLTATGQNYVWTPQAGDSLTLGNIAETEVTGTQEAQQGKMEVDLTLAQQESVTIA